MTVILNILIEFAVSVVNLIFTPINYTIENYLPSIDTGLNAISDFINYIGGYIDFIMGWLDIPSYILQLLSAYIIFIITIRPLTYGIKILFKWISKFKAN